jgi:hypothetical protein
MSILGKPATLPNPTPIIRTLFGHIQPGTSEEILAGQYKVKLLNGSDITASYTNPTDPLLGLAPHTLVIVQSPSNTPYITVLDDNKGYVTGAKLTGEIIPADYPVLGKANQALVTIIDNPQDPTKLGVTTVNNKQKIDPAISLKTSEGVTKAISNVKEVMGNMTKITIGTSETIDTVPIKKVILKYEKIKEDISAKTAVAYGYVNGELIPFPFSEALGITTADTQYYLGKIIPFDDLQKALKDLEKIYNDITSFIDTAITKTLAAIETINWVEEGALPYINALVEKFGFYEFKLGPVKLSVGASLGNDISSFVDFNTGIPIADEFLTTEVNEFLQDKLPKINIGEALGIPGFNSEYKGPPPKSILIPNNLKLPVVGDSPWFSDDEALKASQEKLAHLKDSIITVPDVVTIGLDDFKSKKDKDYNKTPASNTPPTQPASTVQLSATLGAVPVISAVRDYNNLDVRNYPHHGVALSLIGLGIPFAGQLAQGLKDLAEYQSINSFIDLLVLTTDNVYEKFKLLLGKAYVLNTDTALEVKALVNKSTLDGCVSLPNDSNALIKAAINKEDITLTNTLSSFYLDDAPYKYNTWLSPEDIITDLSGSLKEAAELLHKGNITNYLAQVIYTHNRINIKSYPNHLNKLQYWVTTAYGVY